MECQAWKELRLSEWLMGIQFQFRKTESSEGGWWQDWLDCTMLWMRFVLWSWALRHGQNGFKIKKLKSGNSGSCF